MISRNPVFPSTPKHNTQNLVASLNQKDKIILILEKELQEFGELRSKYQRVKDRKSVLLDKCESITRQNNINRDSQNVRVDNSQKCASELRGLIISLEKELQSKQNQLRGLKSQAQVYLGSTQKVENDICQFGDAIDSVKSSLQVLSIETNRTSQQIVQTKDDINRIRDFHRQTQIATEKIKNQVHNTQSFIRKLAYEEDKQAQELTKYQEQNTAIDGIIEDLTKVQELTKNKVREAREDRQNLQLRVKSKQIQKGRIATEYQSGLRQFRAEKEREKNLNELTNSRKGEIQRLTAMLKEVIEEGNDFTQTNIQVETINNQLHKDLSHCRKHLQNVMKNNAHIKECLQFYYKTNLTAIKKLSQPDQSTGFTPSYPAYEKSGLENAETGQGFLESV